MREAIVLDPLAEVFGQPVADFLLYVRWRERIERPDEVIQRNPRLRFAERVLVEVFPLERRVEILRQVVIDELRRQRVITVERVHATVRVVQRGIERTGGDELREFGNWLGPFQFLLQLL